MYFYVSLNETATNTANMVQRKGSGRQHRDNLNIIFCVSLRSTANNTAKNSTAQRQ